MRIRTHSHCKQLAVLIDASVTTAPTCKTFIPPLPFSTSGTLTSTVEFELRRIEQFATKAQARARVAAWIEEYNRDRRHSALGMRSPLDYERALREQPPEAA